MKKDVSIILVNYKTKELTRSCIKSIYEKTKEIDFDIYVVDNASSDGIDELIKDEFPQINFIQSKTNLGFGAGNNLALRETSSKYVFLLNTDTILINNAIKILYDFMESNSNVGACGGNLYDKNNNNIHSYGNIFDLTDLLLKTFPLRYFFPKRHKKMKDYGENTAEELKPVDYITGADLMIRKDVLDKVGLFNEKIFMYFEEAELQYRIHKAGYEIYIVPDSKIIHLHDKSPQKRNRMYYEFSKSKYLMFRLCYGTKRNLWYIKTLTIIGCISKLFKHLDAMINLIKYVANDKIED